MFFKNKFDLIVSIGEDCACSSYLRRFRLQDFSYPFDWLTKASFQTRIEMLKDDFLNFFVKENLQKMEKPADSTAVRNDYYKDVKYDFYFYHDFLVGVDFEKNYFEINEKYQRRIKRVYRMIEKSQKVLFVWFGRSGKISFDEIERNYKILAKKFQKQEVYLLLIQYDKDKNTQISLCDNKVLVCEYDNLSNADNPTLGNFELNKKIFKKIKRKAGVKLFLKYTLYVLNKIPVEILPMKKTTRAKIKKSLKAKYFKEKL